MKNGKPATHTDRARELAKELESMEWEEDSSVTIVDNTGHKLRVTAKSDAEIRLEPPSVPPDTATKKTRNIVTVLNTLPPWGRVIVLLAVIAAVVFWKTFFSP